MNKKITIPYWVTFLTAFLFGLIGGIDNPLTWIAFVLWVCTYLITSDYE